MQTNNIDEIIEICFFSLFKKVPYSYPQIKTTFMLQYIEVPKKTRKNKQKTKEILKDIFNQELTLIPIENSYIYRAELEKNLLQNSIQKMIQSHPKDSKFLTNIKNLKIKISISLNNYDFEGSSKAINFKQLSSIGNISLYCENNSTNLRISIFSSENLTPNNTICINDIQEKQIPDESYKKAFIVFNNIKSENFLEFFVDFYKEYDNLKTKENDQFLYLRNKMTTIYSKMIKLCKDILNFIKEEIDKYKLIDEIYIFLIDAIGIYTKFILNNIFSQQTSLLKWYLFDELNKMAVFDEKDICNADDTIKNYLMDNLFILFNHEIFDDYKKFQNNIHNKKSSSNT